MARPRGAARSRRLVPPLDKSGRSGLLALRRFHDGLQTPTLVRLLVRTEKEEISTGQKTIDLFFHHHQAAARPPAERTRHARVSTTSQKEIAFGNPKFPNAISFWLNMATDGPRAHPQQETHGRGRLAAPAFIKTQAGSPSISVPHISQH